MGQRPLLKEIGDLKDKNATVLSDCDRTVAQLERAHKQEMKGTLRRQEEWQAEKQA